MAVPPILQSTSEYLGTVHAAMCADVHVFIISFTNFKLLAADCWQHNYMTVAAVQPYNHMIAQVYSALPGTGL